MLGRECTPDPFHVICLVTLNPGDAAGAVLSAYWIRWLFYDKLGWRFKSDAVPDALLSHDGGNM